MGWLPDVISWGELAPDTAVASAGAGLSRALQVKVADRSPNNVTEPFAARRDESFVWALPTLL